MTRIFLSFDGSFSLSIFHVKQKKKNEENPSIRSLKLSPNATSNSVLFSSLHLPV